MVVPISLCPAFSWATLSGATSSYKKLVEVVNIAWEIGDDFLKLLGQELTCLVQLKNSKDKEQVNFKDRVNFYEKLINHSDMTQLNQPLFKSQIDTLFCPSARRFHRL